MTDFRKMLRDTEVAGLVAALIIIAIMATTSLYDYYKDDYYTYNLNDLGNCMEEWDQAIKDDWNPDFYEDACNAIKEQIQ